MIEGGTTTSYTSLWRCVVVDKPLRIVHPSIAVHIHIFIHPFPLFIFLVSSMAEAPPQFLEDLPRHLQALRNHTLHHKSTAVFTKKGPPTKIPAFGSVCLGEIDFLMLHIGRELSEFGCSKTYWLWAWRIGVDWWYREHDWLGLAESILEISVDIGILERFWSRSEFLASFRCMRVREGVADARGPPSS